MNLKVEKQPKNTYKVLITITKEEVNEAFDHALEHESKDVAVDGFRKGKTPKNVAKKNIDPTKIRSHALNHLLSDAYSKAIKENKLKPIVSPQFDLEVFEEDKEGKVTMTIVERPDIKLGDYKKALKALGTKKKKEEKKDAPATISNKEIIDEVIKASEIEIATLLIEEETNRMMSSLIDQTSKMGITMEQYLESIKKQPKELREEFAKTAEETLKGDFLITEISTKENLEVSDEEIELTINSIPDEKSREALKEPNQRLYVHAVLLKNKTLQLLAELTMPEKKEEQKEESKTKKTNDTKEKKTEKKEVKSKKK